jgi:hypothetical protein
VVFFFQLSKITENVNLGSRKVPGTVHAGDLAASLQAALTVRLFPVVFG